MISPELRKRIIASNRSFHDRFALSYDGCYKNHTGEPQFREKLERELQLAQEALAGRPEPIEALDCGAGTGFVTIPLLEKGYRVTAVDLSSEMLEVCRDKTKGFPSPPRIVVSEVGEFLESDAGQYDLVVYSSVLHHLPDYLNTVQITLARIKPGGVLYVALEPCLSQEQGWRGRLFFQIEIALDRLFHEPKDVLPAIGRKLKRFLGYRPDSGAEESSLSEHDESYFAHYHYVTGGVDREKIAQLLQENGFEILRIERSALSSYLILRWLKRLFRVKEFFWFLARKPSSTA